MTARTEVDLQAGTAEVFASTPGVRIEQGLEVSRASWGNLS